MARRGRHAAFWRYVGVMLAALAGLGPTTARAGAERLAEERVDEARAAPMPALKKGSWLVVPIPVADPTVGNGLQLAILYLHPKAEGEEESPQATSGIGAMATDTHSRLVGAFHDASYLGDRLRLSAFAGTGRFNLTYYVVGDTPQAGKSLPYEFDGDVGQIRVDVRVPRTAHWFVGLTYLLLESKATLGTSELVPGLPDFGARIRSAALGAQITYDSRDSNYYPTTGQYARARWMDYGARWGGDREYAKGDLFYNHYLSLGPQWVAAFRGRLQSASGNTPFWDLPTLDMRGFSRDRYRDNYTVSLTAEGRWKFSSRWGLVAFAEAGRFAPAMDKLSDSRTISSWGGGVRWQVSADRDMHVGLDFAISTDDRAVFIQIGERF